MDERPFFEDNVSRLVRAAMPPGARPDAVRRAEVLLKLTAEAESAAARSAFPDCLVGVLAAALTMLAAWVAARLGAGFIPGAPGPALTVLVIALVLNLTMVPVAGFLIVVRRHHV
jgi:hypothetical protein